MLKIGDTYTNKVEARIVDEVDVLVAGGGTAGCVAAIAAARNGTSVLLVERYGFLGGMMTAGNAGLTKYTVHSPDKTEYRRVTAQLSTHPSLVQIIGGIPMEITKKLMDMGAAVGTDGTAGSYVFTASEDFKWLLLNMIEEAGVKLLLHSLVVDVIKKDNTIKGIIVENKSGRQAFLAKNFIDTTGDGDVAVKSGVPFEIGVGPNDPTAKNGIPLNTMMKMGVMFKVGNVNMERCLEYLRGHPDKFLIQTTAIMDLDDAYKSFVKGDMVIFMVHAAEHTFNLYNSPIPGVVICCCPMYSGNGLSVQDLTKGEVALAKEVHKRVIDMKTSVPGFENAWLLDCPQIGVRETRHILGEYILSIEDIFLCRQFEDTIGRGCHPPDVSPIPKEIEEHSLPPRWYFNIPYRCLVPKGIDNLLIAGRCISSTHEAFGCIRSTVQCMITGQAAGTASALSVKQVVKHRDLNPAVLQRTLIAQGVIL